jgi:hypothetical protein
MDTLQCTATGRSNAETYYHMKGIYNLLRTENVLWRAETQNRRDERDKAGNTPNAESAKIKRICRFNSREDLHKHLQSFKRSSCESRRPPAVFPYISGRGRYSWSTGVTTRITTNGQSG